jgi:hypothetical protein
MIVSIMQPYFFPYIGYFQLVAQSDVFVFYDDVQYIKSGWINRNRIVDRKGEVWITLPVGAASHALSILERSYLAEKESSCRVLRKIENAYGRTLNFRRAFPLIREILQFDDLNVAAFNINLLESIARQLGLRARFVRSSELPIPKGLSGQSRVIAICQLLGATKYVNPIGGAGLYDAQGFAKNGILLRFLRTAVEPNSGSFSYVSIINDLMTKTDATIKQQLQAFHIVSDVGNRILNAPPSPALLLSHDKECSIRRAGSVARLPNGFLLPPRGNSHAALKPARLDPEDRSRK